MSNKRTIFEVLQISDIDYMTIDASVYRSIFTDVIFPELLKCVEFDNVSAGRVIEMPMYFETAQDVLNKGGDVIDVLTHNYSKQLKHVVDYRFNPNEDIIEFNDYVQIYDIRIVGKSYKDKDLPVGLWYHPVKYDEMTFAPKHKVELIFEMPILQDIEELGLRDELVDRMFSLIKGGESNVPYDPIIVIRCSNESIKQITKKENTNR